MPFSHPAIVHAIVAAYFATLATGAIRPISLYIGLIRCGSGGTGRRARLRILWGNTRGGSSPLSRTKIRFFNHAAAALVLAGFNKISNRPISTNTTTPISSPFAIILK